MGIYNTLKNSKPGYYILSSGKHLEREDIRDCEALAKLGIRIAMVRHVPGQIDLQLEKATKKKK